MIELCEDPRMNDNDNGVYILREGVFVLNT